jgi:hypothetical protein
MRGFGGFNAGGTNALDLLLFGPFLTLIFWIGEICKSDTPRGTSSVLLSSTIALALTD